jgi:hypothetical protein
MKANENISQPIFGQKTPRQKRPETSLFRQREP